MAQNIDHNKAEGRMPNRMTRPYVAPMLLALAVWMGMAPAFSAPRPQGKPVTRCGWFDNPSPANAMLTDRDGQWIIAIQGGHQADGVWPDIPPDQWVKTNVHYGYGCACLTMITAGRSNEVRRVLRAQARPLDACQNDPALPKRDPMPEADATSRCEADAARPASNGQSTWQFTVTIVSGSRSGQIWTGTFSVARSALAAARRQSIELEPTHFQWFYAGSLFTRLPGGGFDAPPKVRFVDGNPVDILATGGNPDLRFGFSAGFDRRQFGRTSEAFIQRNLPYFGYLDPQTFVDGAGHITFQPADLRLQDCTAVTSQRQDRPRPAAALALPDPA